MTLCGLDSLLQSRTAQRISPGNCSLPTLLHRQGYSLTYLLSEDHQNFLNPKHYYSLEIASYRDGHGIDPRHTHDDLRVFREFARLPVLPRTQPGFMMFGLMSAHVWGSATNAFGVSARTS